MKNYLLFGFDSIYPSGGMNDLVGYFESREELYKYLKNYINKNTILFDFYQIVDVKCDMKIIDFDKNGIKEFLNSEYFN